MKSYKIKRYHEVPNKKCLVCAINALASEEACNIGVAHGGFLQALIFVGVIGISFRKLPFRMALVGEEFAWIHESHPPSKMKNLFHFFCSFFLMKAPLTAEPNADYKTKRKILLVDQTCLKPRVSYESCQLLQPSIAFDNMYNPHDVILKSYEEHYETYRSFPSELHKLWSTKPVLTKLLKSSFSAHLL